jgi:hypothetical protein
MGKMLGRNMHPTSSFIGFHDPKRIHRRLRITQNSQRQLRTLIMAPADREREKIQSSQNSVKMA